MTAPRPLLGIGLMLTAMAILPMIDVLAKMLGEAGLPILVVVWARAMFGTLMMLPLALRAGGGAALLPDRWVYHAGRAALLWVGGCGRPLSRTQSAASRGRIW